MLLTYRLRVNKKIVLFLRNLKLGCIVRNMKTLGLTACHLSYHIRKQNKQWDEKSVTMKNDINERFFNITKWWKHSFYLNSLRKRKRYSPWIYKDKIKDLDCVKSYYGYSNEKAKQALRVLTKEQLNFIKSKIETGGTK